MCSRKRKGEKAMNHSGTQVKGGLCRACTSLCPVHVEIENGRTVSLKPVKDHPVYHGYACAKGRASVEFPYLDGRLLHSMKRQADGKHAPIESGRALDEIAAIIKRTVERHGPRAVALYNGTMAGVNPPAISFAEAFMTAIASPMTFSSMQIDQPGKPISMALHGMWMAGQANMDQADAWLLIGNNPVVSLLGPPNPAHVVHRAKKRGAKIFVIDPRKTDMARQADIFLQVPPGQDAVILAGLIHVILAETLHDQDFIDDNVDGLAALTRAVAPFTPEMVANRVGVAADQITAMARGYAKARAGIVFAGTGPNMSPHGTLTEYLRQCLMSICGHWRRAGDPVSMHGILVHLPPALAQAVPPSPGWDLGEKMRVRGLTNTASGMPTSALAEEILLDGDGQVKVLIVNGGNPMMAWPDQLRTQQAMKKLELLVCIDPVMSDTAKYAHYVIAPRVHLETMNTTALTEWMWAWFPVTHPLQPYAAVSPALVPPPSGSDLIGDWQFFFEVAARMGVQLRLKPVAFAFDPAQAQERAVALAMTQRMSDEQMWETLLEGSPIPLAEVKPYPTGHVFDLEAFVQPKTPGWAGRLDIGNAEMMADLQRAGGNDAEAEATGFRFRMVGRRLKDRFNSSWREHSVATRQWRHNPAFMHPDDMASLGLVDGDLVEIRSRRGAIKGVAETENSLLPGVIAMTHAWGGNPEDDADPLTMGANTGLLTDNTVDYDRYSAMPRMSTIPVNIRRLADLG
jgi:anaerobic selenocysteine-containing dehydrogenase